MKVPFNESQMLNSKKVTKANYNECDNLLPSCYLDKENEMQNFNKSLEKDSKLSAQNLPEVILNLSEALEMSNNTVQNLKNQLETVLQRESNLQFEFKLLSERCDNLIIEKSQIEMQFTTRNEKEVEMKREAEQKIEELKEVLKQKNKAIEMKNLEIAEFTRKLHGIMQEHNNEVSVLTDQIKEIKKEMKKGEEKQT